MSGAQDMNRHKQLYRGLYTKMYEVQSVMYNFAHLCILNVTWQALRVLRGNCCRPSHTSICFAMWDRCTVRSLRCHQGHGPPPH